MFLQHNKDKIEVKVGDRNLYKVELHKGKTTEQYDWLVWDKNLTDKQEKQIRASLPEDIANMPNNATNKMFEDSYGNKQSGEYIYKRLSQYLGSPKEASLFLLRAGIDGIKYPAESISRGATSETARGFNYVVFDENAVTIEEVIKFQNQLQKNRGAMLINDGKALIYALTNPNVSTPLHQTL